MFDETIAKKSSIRSAKKTMVHRQKKWFRTKRNTFPGTARKKKEEKNTAKKTNIPPLAR